MNHICPVCEAYFDNWREYYGHMTYQHNVVHPARKVIKPLNTSGRTKNQIVADEESAWLYKHIIEDDRQHGEDCRCNRCFQIALDTLVTKTEREMNECTSSSISL